MDMSLARFAMLNMAEFEDARAASHGTPRHCCFESLLGTVDYVSYSQPGSTVWIGGSDHEHRQALVQAGWTYEFPGVLMTRSLDAPQCTTQMTDYEVCWDLSPGHVCSEYPHPWHGANTLAVAADMRLVERGVGVRYAALCKGSQRNVLASCLVSSCSGGITGLYGVGVQPHLRRMRLGLNLIDGVIAHDGVNTHMFTLQCHPMYQPFYGKSGFVTAGTCEAWTFHREQHFSSADEAMLITAVCGSDLATLEQEMETVRIWATKRLTLWSSGATILHLAAWLGSRDVVQFLVYCGCPIATTDLEYGLTPAGWARHFSRFDIQSLL